MARNAKRIPIEILNPPEGCRRTTSLAHARRYEKQGIARFVSGKLLFLRDARCGSDGTVRIDVVFRITDSGRDGFARYPIPTQYRDLRRRYPALGRQGAGL